MLEAVAGDLGIEAISPDVRPPFWWPTIIAGLALVATAAFTVYHFTRETKLYDPRHVELETPTRDAYERGGRPLPLEGIGHQIFSERLTDYVIALDRHARARDDETRARLDTAYAHLLDDDARAALGDEVFEALTNVADSCRATLIDGDADGGDADELNDALTRAGLGYYVDYDTLGTSGGATALLYIHEVLRVQIYDVSGSEPVRVLRLRRLDTLSIQTNAVGSTHQGAGAAVVRLHLAADEILDRLLPTLGTDASYDLWNLRRGDRDSPVRGKLEARAGEVMRSDFENAGVSLDVGASMASLLAERDTLFDRFENEAKRRGYEIARPDTYRIDVDRYRSFEKFTSAKDVRRLERLDEDLGHPRFRPVYETIKEAYVSAVEVHEVQHRLDYRAEFIVPEVLEKYAGKTAHGYKPSRFARRLVTEFSAYLAEIAGSQLPRLVLVRLARNAFHTRNWSTTYAETAVGVIESLARELGIEHGPFVASGEVDREELAAVLLQILDLEPEMLQETTRAAFQTSFARPLAQLTRRD